MALAYNVELKIYSNIKNNMNNIYQEIATMRKGMKAIGHTKEEIEQLEKLRESLVKVIKSHEALFQMIKINKDKL